MIQHGDFLEEAGAGEGARTPDLLITDQLLYQLSYTSAMKFYTMFTFFNLKRPLLSEFNLYM